MENLDKFDPRRLRVCTDAAKPASPVAQVPPSSYRAGRRREYMPEVDWTLFTRMAALAGKAGWVGLAIYRLVVMRKTRTVTVNRQQLADELAIDRKSVYSGLKALEHEGVLRTKGGRGSFATVELLIEPW
jgi:hypothetical protein